MPEQTSDLRVPGDGERWRCGGCGNLTRFDVVVSRRTRSFHHYTLGGELEVEDEQVLAEEVESVTCRWCGPTGTVEAVTAVTAEGELP